MQQGTVCQLHTASGQAAVEVALLEVTHTRRVDGPVVAAAVLSAPILHEALIDRKVVADTVSPGARGAPVVRVVLLDVAVDVTQQQALLRTR